MEYCSECDMMFSNSENLLIHKETVHTDEDMPNNKCDQCSYKSTNNTLLESHKIGVHEPPKIMLRTMTFRQIGLLNINLINLSKRLISEYFYKKNYIKIICYGTNVFILCYGIYFITIHNLSRF